MPKVPREYTYFEKAKRSVYLTNLECQRCGAAIEKRESDVDGVVLVRFGHHETSQIDLCPECWEDFTKVYLRYRAT